MRVKLLLGLLAATATVIVDELQGNTLVRTAAAALTVTASVE